MNAASLTAIILAHQGGWDEVLLIAVPIVAIVIALRVAKKRVDAAVVAPAAPSSTSPVDGGDQRAE